MKNDLIKIIPRAKEKAPNYVNFLFWFSLILLIVLLFLFFVLKMDTSSLLSKKVALEKEITSSYGQTGTEKELSQTSNRIKDFSFLMKEHKKPSVLMDFLSSSCHSQVRFKNLQVDLKTNKVVLSGESNGFGSLEEQILGLKKNKKVKGLQVSDVFLNRLGIVEFNLTFTFLDNS